LQSASNGEALLSRIVGEHDVVGRSTPGNRELVRASDERVKAGLDDRASALVESSREAISLELFRDLAFRQSHVVLPLLLARAAQQFGSVDGWRSHQDLWRAPSGCRSLVAAINKATGASIAAVTLILAAVI
jgi:hypothetical protein